MDLKRLLAVIFLFVAFFVAVLTDPALAGVVNGITYTDWSSRAINVSDGANSFGRGTVLGFFNLADVNCRQNCTGFNGSNFIRYSQNYANLQDAVNASNGSILYVNSTTLTKIPLILYNGTKIRGFGRNNTIITVASGAYSPGTFAAIQNSCAGTAPTCTNFGIEISDLTLDVNRAGQAGLVANELYGISLQWSTQATLTNLNVSNAYSSGIGIWPSNPANPASRTASVTKLDNIIAMGNGGAQSLDGGVFISDGTAQPVSVIFTNSYMLNNTANGFEIEDSNGGTIVSNIITQNNSFCGVGLQAVNHITLSSIQSRYNNRSGICSSSAVGESFVTITGSTFEQNGQYGIYDQGHDWTIVGNQVNWNDWSGIEIEGYNTMVSGNGIYGNGVNLSSNRSGILIYNNIYGGNKILNNIIGKDPSKEKVAGSQNYGIVEGNAIISLPRNLYAFNGLEFNGIKGLLKNASSSASVAYQNDPVSPYFFGANATIGGGNYTAYGAGDTFFNLTKNSMCLATAAGTANWVFLGNSTGSC